MDINLVLCVLNLGNNQLNSTAPVSLSSSLSKTNKRFKPGMAPDTIHAISSWTVTM